MAITATDKPRETFSVVTALPDSSTKEIRSGTVARYSLASLGLAMYAKKFSFLTSMTRISVKPLPGLQPSIVTVPSVNPPPLLPATSTT